MAFKFDIAIKTPASMLFAPGYYYIIRMNLVEIVDYHSRSCGLHHEPQTAHHKHWWSSVPARRRQPSSAQKHMQVKGSHGYPSSYRRFELYKLPTLGGSCCLGTSGKSLHRRRRLLWGLEECQRKCQGCSTELPRRWRCLSWHMPSPKRSILQKEEGVAFWE